MALDMWCGGRQDYDDMVEYENNKKAFQAPEDGNATGSLGDDNAKDDENEVSTTKIRGKVIRRHGGSNRKAKR